MLLVHYSLWIWFFYLKILFSLSSQLRACYKLTTKLRREIVLGATSIDDPPQYLTVQFSCISHVLCIMNNVDEKNLLSVLYLVLDFKYCNYQLKLQDQLYQIYYTCFFWKEYKQQQHHKTHELSRIKGDFTTGRKWYLYKQTGGERIGITQLFQRIYYKVKSYLRNETVCYNVTTIFDGGISICLSKYLISKHIVVFSVLHHC